MFCVHTPVSFLTFFFFLFVFRIFEILNVFAAYFLLIKYSCTEYIIHGIRIVSHLNNYLHHEGICFDELLEQHDY